MTTCKSPRKVLQVAYATAQASLPAYAHRFSPKKFTQHQLFACLVFKGFLETDYRGVVAMLIDCESLRQVIGLHCVPHFTTLQEATDRLLKSRLAGRHKLIHVCGVENSEKPERWEFHDVIADPAEQHPIASPPADIVSTLRARLDQWGETMTTLSHNWPAPGEVTFTPEEEERLRSLGYLP